MRQKRINIQDDVDDIVLVVLGGRRSILSFDRSMLHVYALEKDGNAKSSRIRKTHPVIKYYNNQRGVA
jgi:hypothetical protein